ncbi:MAG: ABC transporter ATP-binding protein [Spirochaetaceae bacterium]|nr:ABC transporter ATP-binding protein [Spirochaetaceae bacterium]
MHCKDRVVKALDGVDFDAEKGKITALIGGSGSGKSVLSRSVLGLIDKPGMIKSGEIRFNGVDLRTLQEKELLKIRGRNIAMIFQEPINAMNPVVKVKRHFYEVLGRCAKMGSKKEMRNLCIQTLSRMSIRNAEEVFEKYPFELSGGMCQRVMIAMGLLAIPELLIADEPTSALDLTTQAVILKELNKVRDEGVSIILITHDLGVVAHMADDLYVIKDGRIVEHGSVFNVFKKPEHEYTKQLLQSV